jgi:hypothetical protein
MMRSLLITQVKLQRAWSAPGWLTATRYKWWQRGDSGVWWMPVLGRVSVKLWAFVAMKGWGFIRVYGRGFDRGRRRLSSWTADAVAEQMLNIMRELASSFEAKLSGDAVEWLSWLRKLSCSERGQRLDGWPLHVTICKINIMCIVLTQPWFRISRFQSECSKAKLSRQSTKIEASSAFTTNGMIDWSYVV